jgi:PIN domain nuclease of toxin-antitoxin system
VVSAASAWETAVKRALGKLEAPDDFAGVCQRAGYELLLIDFAHARAAGALPRIHSDPFDRMLVAQAQLESLTLMTSDTRLEEYAVHVIRA